MLHLIKFKYNNEHTLIIIFIKMNLSEYKKGKYKSSKQAIAVSYTQTSKKYPKCELVRNH